jgi:branched-chain amino acid transport system permease protein
MLQFIQSALVPGLSQGAIYGLIAIAFAVLHATTGVINFAHGQLVVLMPIVIVVGVKAGMPLALAYLVGAVALVLAALITEWLAIRPFVQTGRAVSWILSTLGVSVVLAEVLAIPSNGDAINFPFGITSKPFSIAGVTATPAELLAIPVLLILAAAIIWFYRGTRLGMELRAVGDDVQGAEAVGISRAKASRTAMLIAAIIAGITGILVGSSQILTPSLGLAYTFNGFVAAAMGGMSSVAGGVVGGLVVGLVSQIAAVYLGALFGNLTVFLLLIAVYAIRPYGLFGARPVREV